MYILKTININNKKMAKKKSKKEEAPKKVIVKAPAKDVDVNKWVRVKGKKVLLST
jgi:hypothetical protein